MLIISKRAELMIRYAVMTHPALEVGGYGKAELKDGVVTVTDIIIPPQEVGGADVDFGPEGVAWAMEQLASRGETMSDWPINWHSHGIIPAKHSSTDSKTLETYAEMMSGKWAIGIVTNAKNEWEAWLSTKHEPWGLNQENIKVEFEELPVDAELFMAVGQMMQHVTRPAPATPTTGAITRYHPQSTTGYIGPSTGPKNPVDVWCDIHSCLDGDCPFTHAVTANALCKHSPNCGGDGCFAKKERKKMREFLREQADKAFDAAEAQFWTGEDSDDEDNHFGMDDDEWDAYFGSGYGYGSRMSLA